MGAKGSVRSIRVKTTTNTHQHPPTPTNTMDAQIEMLTLQLNAAMTTLAEIRGTPTKAKAKATKAEKVTRAPNSWGLFRTRISTLLKENELPIKLSPEMLQFCSRLKTEKPIDDWTDDAILEARRGWVAPPKKAKDVESEGETSSTSIFAEAPVEKPATPATPVKAVKAKAPKKAVEKPAPVEAEVDEGRMEPTLAKIGAKDYYVNGYGDVFAEKDFAYLGTQKGQKIVKGEKPARVVAYEAKAN